jgi:hypothetical protein
VPPAPPAAPAPPPAAALPPTTSVGSSNAAASVDAAGRPIFYTDGAWYYADGTAAAGPGLPPPASTGASSPQGAAPGATTAGVPTSADEPDAYDPETFQLFSVEVEGRVDPGLAEAKLPSGAWVDFRDYFAKDQPFLGVHVRNQGRGMKNVLASDLWSRST